MIGLYGLLMKADSKFDEVDRMFRIVRQINDTHYLGDLYEDGKPTGALVLLELSELADRERCELYEKEALWHAEGWTKVRWKTA